MTQRRITLAAATLVTTVGLAMSAAAAFDRAGTPTDRALSMALGCCLVIGAHMIPALTKGPASRALWLGLLLSVTYGHATWIISSAARAGAARADAVHSTGHTAALQAQLDALQAPPAAQAAAALARAKAKAIQARQAADQCRTHCSTATATAAKTQAALDEAMAQQRLSDQAETLREQLATAALSDDTRRAHAAADPVSLAVATALHIEPSTVLLAVSLLSALLVEMMGTLLWIHALATHNATTEQRTTATPNPQPAAEVTDMSRRARLRANARPWATPGATDDHTLHAALAQVAAERPAETSTPPPRQRTDPDTSWLRRRPPSPSSITAEAAS